MRATVAITTLLLGPLDVGNALIGREGILEMMLTMANSGDELQQKVRLFRGSWCARGAPTHWSVVGRFLDLPHPTHTPRSGFSVWQELPF